MPRPHRAEALSDARLTADLCLSIACIGPKSRTEKPRKTEIGIEIAHVTLDSDTTFKVKRSKRSTSMMWSQSVLVLVLQVWCFVMKHHVVTLVIIMILKDTTTFQVLFISFSILCLEHHYCGNQQWRSLT